MTPGHTWVRRRKDQATVWDIVPERVASQAGADDIILFPSPTVEQNKLDSLLLAILFSTVQGKGKNPNQIKGLM